MSLPTSLHPTSNIDTSSLSGRSSIPDGLLLPLNVPFFDLFHFALVQNLVLHFLTQLFPLNPSWLMLLHCTMSSASANSRLLVFFFHPLRGQTYDLLFPSFLLFFCLSFSASLFFICACDIVSSGTFCNPSQSSLLATASSSHHPQAQSIVSSSYWSSFSLRAVPTLFQARDVSFRQILPPELKLRDSPEGSCLARCGSKMLLSKYLHLQPHTSRVALWQR